VQAQEPEQQAANATSTSSSSEVSVSWIVQRAQQAAGLGIGVFCTGWVLIVLLSLVFGNWGLPKAAEGRDDAYAPAAEVHVNATQKKDKKAKHNQVRHSVAATARQSALFWYVVGSPTSMQVNYVGCCSLLLSQCGHAWAATQPLDPIAGALQPAVIEHSHHAAACAGVLAKQCTVTLLMRAADAIKLSRLLQNGCNCTFTASDHCRWLRCYCGVCRASSSPTEEQYGSAIRYRRSCAVHQHMLCNGWHADHQPAVAAGAHPDHLEGLSNLKDNFMKWKRSAGSAAASWDVQCWQETGHMLYTSWRCHDRTLYSMPGHQWCAAVH
jgi:hypothetical protein